MTLSRILAHSSLAVLVATGALPGQDAPPPIAIQDAPPSVEPEVLEIPDPLDAPPEPDPEVKVKAEPEPEPGDTDNEGVVKEGNPATTSVGVPDAEAEIEGVTAPAPEGTPEPEVAAELSPTETVAALSERLAGKRRALLSEAEVASDLAAAFVEFLASKDTDNSDRPALRNDIVRERKRARTLQEQAVAVQAAHRELQSVPSPDKVSLAALQEAYAGLGDLGTRGKEAWDRLLAEREISLETLESDFTRDQAETTSRLADLETVRHARELLLAAVDSKRTSSTAVEFDTSLKLPRLVSAAALGFGLEGRPEDPDLQAQITLVALVGYSQFFWDHHTGARSHLSESEFPRDHARNILGVSNGSLLTSEAVVENRSSLYYLSPEAKERFNARIRALWEGPDTITVNRWDQNYAQTFFKACEALSTSREDTLVPNPHALALLDAIDNMIAEKHDAELAVEVVEARYAERRDNAKRFDEKSRLSSAQFNAQIWAREADRTLASFSSAHQLFRDQLAASEDEDWTPNVKAITAAARTLRSAHNRLVSVHKVKEELLALLE